MTLRLPAHTHTFRWERERTGISAYLIFIDQGVVSFFGKDSNAGFGLRSGKIAYAACGGGMGIWS